MQQLEYAVRIVNIIQCMSVSCQQCCPTCGDFEDHRQFTRLYLYDGIDRVAAMLKREIQIINRKGLHARASAKLTRIASKFPCEIWMSRAGRRANVKSIMGVMMLSAVKGSRIVIETDGEREQEAMDTLLALINGYFGEGE